MPLGVAACGLQPRHGCRRRRCRRRRCRGCGGRELVQHSWRYGQRQRCRGGGSRRRPRSRSLTALMTRSISLRAELRLRPMRLGPRWRWPWRRGRSVKCGSRYRWWQPEARGFLLSRCSVAALPERAMAKDIAVKRQIHPARPWQRCASAVCGSPQLAAARAPPALPAIRPRSITLL